MATIRGGKRMDAALRQIADRLNKAKSVRIGFLEDATYPDGQQVAEVAAYLNYGTSKMPPRPFFSQMVEANKDGWGAKLARVLKAADYDTELALGRMGEGIKGQLQDAIVAFNDPPDSKATMARKKAAGQEQATLIETGHMLASVDYEVSEDEPT